TQELQYSEVPSPQTSLLTLVVVQADDIGEPLEDRIDDQVKQVLFLLHHGEVTERDHGGGHRGVPAGLADLAERLSHNVAQVEPDILVPRRHDDVLIADTVDQRRVHAFKVDQDIGSLRERVAVPDVADVGEEVTALDPPVPDGV